MVKCRSLSQKLKSTLYVSALNLLSEGIPVARDPRIMFWEGL